MPDWNELLLRREYQWTEPHPKAVELAQKLKAKGFSRVLDLGCGAGRHVVYLSSLGFQVTGMDLSTNGLVHTKSRMMAEHLKAGLLRAEMSLLPFGDESFDCVISVYVLHHSSRARVKRALAEIRRVLVPRGMVLALVLSDDDWKFGRGRQLEQGTYLTDEGDEAGVVHHFFSEGGLSQMLAGFSVLELEKEVLDDPATSGNPVRHRHWAALAEKAR